MTDALGRLTASLTDRYRIERELGAGGMATVYLAHDVRHDRKVALKVLRPELSAILGAERFLHEIKTTANLQHPHILSLFDSGEADGLVYYVMPYVEGESLRDRLNREKQLPVEVAVRIAREVADALEYAHQHGVVHRDIKPENILLHGGHAMVADFGIALAASKSEGGSRMTETGMSLGTPHYMSPEQAMGEREITPKADIYALGCVLYEMLTAEPPFVGATAQAIIARVMTEEPRSLTLQRKTIPPSVEDAVERALQKLPADRFASAAEFGAALTDTGAPGHRGTVSRKQPAVMPSGRLAVLPWVLALLATGVAAWSFARAGGDAPGTGAVVRFEMQPPAGTRVAYPVAGVSTQVALSPDGRLAVFAASTGSGGWRLYVRNLDQLGSRALPGTDGAFNPAFSPDGRWIAFRASDGKLKKVMTDGSALTTLTAMDNSGTVGAGLTWLTDREIVFAKGAVAEGRGLWRVSADGGEPTRFSSFDRASGERLQLSPVSADHGRLVFYSSTIASNTDLTIAVVTAADGKPKVFSGLRGARVSGLVGGFLVYVRGDGALMAAPFRVRGLQMGTPLQISDSIAVHGWDAPVALSANGSLLYQHGGVTSQLVSVDERGVARSLMDSVQVYSHPRLSPDGRRLAVEVQGAAGTDIWISDLGAHTAERLTREGYNQRPEWSPDGGRVMYTSSRAPANALWWQPVDGASGATLVLRDSNPVREGVFTPDGRAILYRVDSPDSNRDIYVLPLSGERKPAPFLVGISDDKQARVSPDSRWVAYVSNESGVEEVYVRALAGASGRVPVSTGGGAEPLWSRDGKRLFYRAGARLVAASVTTSPSFAVGTRTTLFEGPFVTDLYHQNYDVAPDGKSFVMLRPVEENRHLVMVVNWVQELRQRPGGTP